MTRQERQRANGRGQVCLAEGWAEAQRAKEVAEVRALLARNAPNFRSFTAACKAAKV